MGSLARIAGIALLICHPGLVVADELVNVAGPQYGTRVEADTAYSASYVGARVADGVMGLGEGCWFSADQTTLPCALTFELARPAQVRRVVLYQSYWTGNMYHTREFALEASDDGKTWRRLAIGQLPDESLARCEVSLEPVWTRWLRVLVLSSYNSYQTCGLAEVELYAAGIPGFSRVTLQADGQPPDALATYCGQTFVAWNNGAQMLVIDSPAGATAAVGAGETVTVSLDVLNLTMPATLLADARLMAGHAARVTLSRVGQGEISAVVRDGIQHLRLPLQPAEGPISLRLITAASQEQEAGVCWERVRLETVHGNLPIRLTVTVPEPPPLPPPRLPDPRPAIERALIEADWRLQDGIGTPRNPTTYGQAIQQTLARGNQLLADLQASGQPLATELEQWRRLSDEYWRRCSDGSIGTDAAQELWRRVHWLRRSIALSNPLARTGPLVFAKHVPGAFSHQLTQYYGRYARPGGGLYVLEEPGRSMRCRTLTEGLLPAGSCQQPEVSYEGDRIMFSFCEAPTPPADGIRGQAGRYFHLYEIGADGRGLRQLTDGPFDDFAPRYMPDGRVLFVSTRRLGWHRCGNPGCENYTLAVADGDGANPRPVSYHETQEWDPAFLEDGRIIYTRWDYVDRNAVFYEQLWTTGPDGSRPAIFYGNNTLSPVGIWEPRPVPGSRRVMATAAAHHAMTAGSVILVDVAAGVDGPEPITRLTADTPFPESEVAVPPYWRAAVAPDRSSAEAERWPGHCYRSPFPLSERYFLAAFSYLGLVGEPRANAPNMFGLYLVDAFGNRELLYRDLAISSVWPVPLRARTRPPVLPKVLPEEAPSEGTVVLQNVYAATPRLPAGQVRSLRILQVLPKSTPGADNPPVGIPRGAPGKQVLGTVPVEVDGSAHFKVPAGVPLSFQALDETGQAVQVMRSLTYLQPGETVSCVGCHEARVTAPLVQRPRALRRAPSVITPGPEGSRPFSYPRLVQPVLDRACVGCHGGAKPAGGVRLTGEPEGHYTVSYNALAPRVPYSDQGNMDSLSVPGRYGARGSALMKMLLEGHHGVQLTGDELERLVTWMDANVLFYGTFDPEDQARQLRGEVIAGPKLQ